MHGTPAMDDTSARGQRTKDRILRIEPAEALQGVNPRIAAGKSVWQHRPLMRAGNIRHATVGLVHRMQRQPEADLVVVECRILKRLILVPWCRLADPAGFINEMSALKRTSLPRSCSAMPWAIW